MYGYVGLCKAMESDVCLLVTNEEPLYDAYTTYLPKSNAISVVGEQPKMRLAMLSLMSVFYFQYLGNPC